MKDKKNLSGKISLPAWNTIKKQKNKQTKKTGYEGFNKILHFKYFLIFSNLNSY